MPAPSFAALVRTAGEAETAVAAGVDRLIVDGRDASSEGRALSAIVAVAGDRCPVVVLRPLEPAPDGEGGQPHRIALIEADANLGPERIEALAALGLGEALVMPPPNGNPRLLEACPLPALARFLVTCRDRGLAVSLAGGLEPPDVPRLVPLGPAELCLDAAAADFGPTRIALLRDLVREGTAPAHPTFRGDTDLIFMRDWVLPVRIGAYASERHAPQRVRFAVEAEVGRRPKRSADLRDVVSYDLITDSIRRLTAEHVDLVETLAERIAEAVLQHPRVLRVTVTVEKLDLGPGAMGCRITRGRPI